MKRWQTVFLVLIITGSLLTACSGSPAEPASPNVPENSDDPYHVEHVVTIDKAIDALQDPDEWVVLDVRTAEEFVGESRLPNAFGTGRLKGAVNVDKELAFDSEGELLGRDELIQLYEFIGDKKVIVYCHGGARAKIIWGVLDGLGFDAWHYAGSWIDWSKEASIADGGPNEVVLDLTEAWTDNEGEI
jgi:thiosulfate/3-mercaptopyruvate sulfurtransferase